MTAARYPWVPLASNLADKKGALWRFSDKLVLICGASRGRLYQMISVPCFTSSWSSDSICNCGCGDSYMAKRWRVPILTTPCFKQIFGLPWCFSDTKGMEHPQEFTGHGCLHGPGTGELTSLRQPSARRRWEPVDKCFQLLTPGIISQVNHLNANSFLRLCSPG